MTPDQTKDYIETRLRDLGWEVRIPKTGYERIHQYTDGADERLNQLYYKLVSIGSLQPKRQITGDVVRQAIGELKRMDEIIDKSTTKSNQKNNGTDFDSLSIEQLASVLETKVVFEERAAAKESKVEAISHPGGNGAKSAQDAMEEAASGLPKILVVDDSPTIRTAVTNALDNEFVFVEASDGEEAWKLLQERSDIELVITDLMMPKLDGYDLINRIRSDKAPPRIHDIPIIVVTALEDTNAKLKALVNGANDFITKSTDAMELQSRVLARYKLAQTAKELGKENESAQKAAVVSPNSTVTSIPILKRAVTSIAKQAVEQNGARASESKGGSTAVRGEPGKLEKKLSALRAHIKPVTDSTVKPAVMKASKVSVDVYQKLAQLSPTTAITLSATALVAVVIATILFVNESSEPVTIGPVNVAESEQAKQVDSLTPSVTEPQEPVPQQESTGSFTGRNPFESTGADATPPQESAAAKTKSQQTKQAEAPKVTRKTASTAATAQQTRTAAATRAARSTAAQQAKAGAPPQPKTETISVAKSSAATTASGTPSTIEASQTSSPDAAAQTEVEVATEPPTPASVPAAQAEVKPAIRSVATVLPKTVSNIVTQGELNILLRKFVFMYEAGDVEQFVSLFFDNVRTNDRSNKAGLREDYEELFRTTNVRQMILGSVVWEVNENQANGWGNFEVKVRKYGEDQAKAYKGSLTFYVEKINGQLRIKRLYHGQWRT